VLGVFAKVHFFLGFNPAALSLIAKRPVAASEMAFHSPGNGILLRFTLTEEREKRLADRGLSTHISELLARFQAAYSYTQE
jgi:hypothetical protein